MLLDVLHNEAPEAEPRLGANVRNEGLVGASSGVNIPPAGEAQAPVRFPRAHSRHPYFSVTRPNLLLPSRMWPRAILSWRFWKPTRKGRPSSLATEVAVQRQGPQSISAGSIDPVKLVGVLDINFGNNYTIRV